MHNNEESFTNGAKTIFCMKFYNRIKTLTVLSAFEMKGALSLTKKFNVLYYFVYL